MRRSTGLAGILLAIAAVALIVAGPVLVVVGFQGQSQIRQELTAQKIVFPAAGTDCLPTSLPSYGGVQVTTGPQVRAYADMVEVHVQAATGGKTYSEVSEAWIAGGMKDATLAQQRQTAFMGESLRASLLSAYQAWQLSWLVNQPRCPVHRPGRGLRRHRLRDAPHSDLRTGVARDARPRGAHSGLTAPPRPRTHRVRG